MAVIELAPGRTLAGGRYTLDRVIGAGGMATVWKARDERLDRLVAIKLMSDALALDRSYVERFRREARIAAQLWHPNLVRVFDFDVDGGRPLLVMELIEGATLSELLREPPEHAPDPVRLAREMLAAVAHIHAEGVVHRDVKPANVLVGDDGRSRLTDFGIAQPDGATRLTLAGNVIGTAGYLAPEVARGERATPCSDLYSCGVVLRACRAAWPAAPGDRIGLERMIDALTQQQPDARPQSAAAALALLSGARGGARVARTAPTRPWAPARQRRTVRTARAGRSRRVPHPLRLGLSGFAVGVVIAVILVAITGSGSGRGPSATAPTKVAPVPSRSAPLPEQLDALDRALTSR
jgi:serine/threonine protein kinase